jgi:membrane associated rhomboid family serine protease
MCPHCRAFITTRDRVCPYCQEAVGPRTVQSGGSGSILGGFIPHARFTTTMILLVNAALYLATGLYSMRSGNGNLVDIDLQTLVQFGAKFSPLIRQYGQWWRLVTAGFLHGGLMHIAMNSWVLFDLGAQVEEVFGPARLIVIYFCSTVCGFLASMFWSPMVPSVGASAGIMGLIGTMIALGMMHRSALGAAIRGVYVRYAIYVLLFGLLPFFSIDNAAHVGGLAGGFIVAWLAGLPRLANDWREQAWRAMSYVCLALTAISFLKMYLAFASIQQ